MVDRTYRSGRDRYDRDRRYGRQAEQFDATDYDWRDDERGFGQMEGWRDEDYGQFDTAGQSYSRDRETARERGRDPNYARGHDFTTPRVSGRSAASYGVGSQLAANHGEWHDSFDSPTPRREYRDYRRTGEGRGFLERAGDTIAHWLGDDSDYGRGERGYRGRGPANYVRSDERIRDDANDRLTEDWHVDASRIEVTVENGEVTLNGTVGSRAQKRRAEDCVEDLSGVRHVQNNLRVDDSGWNRTAGSQSNPTSSQA